MKTIKLSSMRILFVFSLVMMMTLCHLNMAQAAERTKRLALLPVENISMLEDCGGDKYIGQQLERIVHVPLNGVTKAVEYIDIRDSYRELAALVNSGKYVTKRNRPNYAAIMPVLADKLGADLVIFLRVREAHQFIYHDWWGRTRIDAGVELELLGFDRGQVPALVAAGEGTKKKKALPPGVIKDSVHRYIHDEYTGQGLYELTVEALDELMAGNEMRERVFPTRK
ncbi:MAG: hypothetical protein Q4D07_09290 [Selenomonadaceae bacterium]|nr:hypothetical protein [Selenomonadaceae bacterium]